MLKVNFIFYLYVLNITMKGYNYISKFNYNFSFLTLAEKLMWTLNNESKEVLKMIKEQMHKFMYWKYSLFINTYDIYCSPIIYCDVHLYVYYNFQCCCPFAIMYMTVLYFILMFKIYYCIFFKKCLPGLLLGE
jgi:hypothetical protein